MKTTKTRSTFTGRALVASLALFGMAATPSFAARLAHRWSFNGDLKDSVGGANATTIGTSSTVNYVDGNTAVQTGSDQAGTYATSLKLGTGLVTGGTVTIEVWAKRIAKTYTDMRLFDWGPDTTAYFCLSWNDNADIWVKSGNGNRTGSPYTTVSDSGCWANGKKYYVAVTLTANGDGSTTAHIVRYDTANLTDFGSADTTFSSCDLASILAGNLYLGHSQWWGERGYDATAVYDEVRVWEGGLSRAQMAKNAADGPDTIDMLPLAHRWSFNGDLTDSVGGVMAESIKSSVSGGVIIPSPDSVNYGENRTAVQTGSDQFGTYATSLNLGTGLVTGNDVTLEIWATRKNITLADARLFDWGNGGYNANPTHYVCLPWNSSPVIWTASRTTSSAITDGFSNDTKYHLTFTVTQDGTSSKYHLVRREADDLSKTPLSIDHTVATWTLSNVVGGRLYLGHSQWNNYERDRDANAIYDEVRIYPQVVPDQLLALNAAMGPDTLVLSFDEKGNANINIPANTTLPVNANTLGSGFTIGGKVTFAAGAKIAFDTANYPDGMSFTAECGFVVPSGDVADYVTHTASGDYDVSLQGNTLIVAPSTATSWTGEAGDGNWNNAANWTKGVPTADSEVTVLATATSMPQTAGACKSFTVAGGTLAVDCDWSGLAVKPLIAGAVNLNGHTLTMPSGGIIAQSGASFVNSAATTNEVLVSVSSASGEFNETAYIDGISYLTVGSGVNIVAVNASSDIAADTLKFGSFSGNSVYRQNDGSLTLGTANQTVTLGSVAGSTGVLDLRGGTATFKGMAIAQNGVGANGTLNLSGTADLTATWLDMGYGGNGATTVNQTGGTAQFSANIYVGRGASQASVYNLGGGELRQTGGIFVLSYDNNSKGAFNMTGGSLNTSGAMNIGRAGVGTFTQSGGDVYCGNDVVIGDLAAGTGTYVLNGGKITPKYWQWVGNYGTGTFIQNGGTNHVWGSNNNVLAISGRGGSGTYVMNGGLLEVQSYIRVGGWHNPGTGVLEVNGGTIITPSIDRTQAQGSSTVKLNGGTIKASANGNILKSIGNVVFGSNGTTIDTDGHNTSIAGCGYDTIGGGSLVKAGAGTLTVDAMPPVSALVVSNGTFALSAAADNSKSFAALAHRWSFNGDLAESVGGCTATTIGSKTDVNYVNDNTAVQTGSDQAATYATSLNLGKALSAGEAVTVEIWAKRNSLNNAMRLFDWGLSNTDYICMSWNDNANVWVKTGNADRSGTPAGLVSGCFANDVNYHLGVTFTANSDGTTTIRVVRHNLDDSSEEAKTLTTTFPSCDLLEIIAGNLYLGHSQYSWESGNDATAVYDEVRVWKGILSDDALALSAQKGADATTADIAAIVAKNAEAGTVTRTLDLASGATLNIASGQTLTQPVVKGNGTIAGGTLVVSDKIVATVGECIEASGTIDLSNAKIELVDPENLATPFTFLKPTAGQTLTVIGIPTPTNLPNRWKVSVSANGTGRIVKRGFMIIVK